MLKMKTLGRTTCSELRHSCQSFPVSTLTSNMHSMSTKKVTNSTSTTINCMPSTFSSLQCQFSGQAAFLTPNQQQSWLGAKTHQRPT